MLQAPFIISGYRSPLCLTICQRITKWGTSRQKNPNKFHYLCTKLFVTIQSRYPQSSRADTCYNLKHDFKTNSYPTPHHIRNETKIPEIRVTYYYMYTDIGARLCRRPREGAGHTDRLHQPQPQRRGGPVLPVLVLAGGACLA